METKGGAGKMGHRDERAEMNRTQSEEGTQHSLEPLHLSGIVLATEPGSF